MEKKLKELREAEAKKQRLDMRTGGGFDLDRARLARQKTDPRDSGPSTSTTFSKKDLPAAPSPDSPPRPDRDLQDVQLSQYGGIADSEKPDEDVDGPDFARQDSDLQQSRRPGSSGFRIKDVSLHRSSRPNSRFEPRDGPDAALPGLLPAKSGLLESQLLYEHSKKVPVRANRTGDSFHPRDAPLDFVSGRELTRKLEAASRDLLAASQTRDLASSQSSGKPFKLLPGPTPRGTSQDQSLRTGLPAEDKTAPKRQKGGFSLNKKPAPNKLPLLAPAPKQPVLSGVRRKVGK